VSEDETLSEVATAGDTNREVVQSKKEKEELEEVSGAVSQVIAQEVLEPQPLDPKTQKLLDRIYVEANFLKNEGKFEDYEKKIIEGLAIDPTNLELTKMLTDLYFTLGSHKKALSLLKKIIERDPEDHKSLRQIGEIYFINGDNQTAELLVEKAINLKPDSPKYNLSLVEIYYNTDRINDAIACMEKIIKLRPANTNYLLTLAELYEETGDIANAKKYYFSILEFEPSNEKAKKKLKHYSE
jgi:tetratricopeptide (TPR) repeat protein